MPVSGTLTEKFNRTYIYLNPDPYRGPFTQRLSNIPSTDAPTGYVDNLYTFAPIQHTDGAGTANLFFSIENIGLDASDPDAPPFTIEYAAQNALKYAPFKEVSKYSGIKDIKGVAPVHDARQDNDVALWFSIDDLPNVDSARDKRRIFVNLNLPYNIRSIQTLTATAPLNVRTVSENATVTFDITTLPDA